MYGAPTYIYILHWRADCWDAVLVPLCNCSLECRGCRDLITYIIH